MPKSLAPALAPERPVPLGPAAFGSGPEASGSGDEDAPAPGARAKSATRVSRSLLSHFCKLSAAPVGSRIDPSSVDKVRY